MIAYVTQQRAGLVLCVLLPLLANCVIDGPLGADVNGAHYTAACVIVQADDLGEPLGDVDTSHFGDRPARALVDIDVEEAIAIEIPPPDCGLSAPGWRLFWNDSITEERLDRIIEELRR